MITTIGQSLNILIVGDEVNIRNSKTIYACSGKTGG
jgi:hypothetical protein